MSLGSLEGLRPNPPRADEKHLCDQLLIPLALAGGGSFRTTAPTPHSLTNAEVIQSFLPITIDFRKEPDRAWLVTLTPRDPAP